VPAPLLAPWVVPGVLTLIALAVSATLVVLTHRKRLAELADVPELEDLEPAPAPVAVEPVEPRPPAPEVAPEVEALQRQVESLTRTLSEWDVMRQAPAPVVAEPVALGPTTSYAALSRDLAAAGDAAGAVLAQWVADLQVLRPALADHGPELARAVAAVREEDPVAALRTCREAALGLVRQAGPVRALLAPLDHLADLAPGATPRVVPTALLDLLGPDQRARLAQRGLTA
jgi:hypothetical protein